MVQGMLETFLQSNNLVLFIVLILLFVVAYKLLKAIIEVGIISVLSGLFLVALKQAGMGPAVTINRFFTFMVLGAALYMVFSSASLFIRIGKRIFHGGKAIGKKAKPYLERDKEEEEDEEGKENKEKVVVLDKAGEG
ncbi:MAG: hypothetical protein MUP58_02625 [Candidatus Nanohaloarchaeota archaeon QJJ-9]|nr:hypothetical protein [Candidatus Nanohaloarchaeota archaeon QJJ-9]